MKLFDDDPGQIDEDDTPDEMIATLEVKYAHSRPPAR